MGKKKVAILQPNYIPWKGVFDLIDRVDTFVFYDDVQFTKKDWRNRNRIKTANGPIWLTVPVLTSGRKAQLISETLIDPNSKWQEKHHKSISNAYAKAPFFSEYEFLLHEIYRQRRWENIADLNVFVTKLVAKVLDIKVEWLLASELRKTGGKNGEKAISIAREIGADHFINGLASKRFIDERLFDQAGIQLEFMDYQYPEYPQLHGDFIHEVSILDVIFNCGPHSREMVCK